MTHGQQSIAHAMFDLGGFSNDCIVDTVIGIIGIVNIFQLTKAYVSRALGYIDCGRLNPQRKT
jgi:hypothetical protein